MQNMYLWGKAFQVPLNNLEFNLRDMRDINHFWIGEYLSWTGGIRMSVLGVLSIMCGCVNVKIPPNPSYLNSLEMGSEVSTHLWKGSLFPFLPLEEENMKKRSPLWSLLTHCINLLFLIKSVIFSRFPCFQVNLSFIMRTSSLPYVDFQRYNKHTHTHIHIFPLHLILS